MKPAAVRYLRAGTLEDALGALAEHGSEAKILAGGQSLVPALNMRIARPELLVDVNHLSALADVRSANGAIVVGATVRQADPRLLRHPLLAEALPHVGHFV